MTRVANSSRRCFINSCRNVTLRQVPNSIKIYLLSYFHLYIPDRARICQRHLTTMSLDEIAENTTRQQSEFNADSFVNIVDIYTRALESRTFFDIDEITENELFFWTGLSREKFNRLLNQVPSLQRQSNTPEVDLAVYLCKIRTGEPSARLSSIFNISRRSIDRKIHLSRRCLFSDFVPEYIGLDHITRDEIIERNRIVPNYIFGSEESPKALIIMDGTYLFIEKSSNFLYQRRTYSLHKYRNLIKPFLIVCGDGHIIDITGPYAATTTDSDIMTKILENHDEPIENGAFHYLFHEGDVLILDRGFRDAIPLTETYGYNAYMPRTKRRGETQLTTIDANKSRLVTMCRWVVEAVNGKFKRDFKIFRERIFNRASQNTINDFKIAGAIINCFQDPFEDSQYSDQFIECIRLNLNKPNLLADYVEENNLNRQRITFDRLEADNQHLVFPELTLEDIILIAVGTYHLKIARSYSSEHIQRTGVLDIEYYRHSERVLINNQENVLIRTKIQSRHVRRKTYYTYVLYNTETRGRTAIKEYYCTCIHGRRTLGSCAHVITILYYLGWARHNDFGHPAAFLDSVLIDVEV